MIKLLFYSDLPMKCVSIKYFFSSAVSLEMSDPYPLCCNWRGKKSQYSILWFPNIQHHLFVLTDRSNTSLHHGMGKDSGILTWWKAVEKLHKHLFLRNRFAQVWDLGSKILSTQHRMFMSWIGSCLLTTEMEGMASVCFSYCHLQRN